MKRAIFLSILLAGCGGTKPPPYQPPEGPPCTPVVHLDSCLVATWQRGAEPDLAHWVVDWGLIQAGCFVHVATHTVRDTVDSMRFIIRADSVVIRNPVAAKSMFWLVIPDTAGFALAGNYALATVDAVLYYIDRDYAILSSDFNPAWTLIRTRNDDKSGGALGIKYAGQDTATAYLAWDQRSGPAPQGWGTGQLSVTVSDPAASFSIYERAFFPRARQVEGAVMVAVAAMDSSGNRSKRSIAAVGVLED